MRVLITGVRGKTGAALAPLLAARPDVEVLGGSSRPADLALEGVRPTAFSWDDVSGWSDAVEGVDAVYLVRPDRADAPELTTALIEQTSAQTRIVLLSEQDAEYAGPEGWATRAERAVRESGRAYTILRPSWFMQVFTDPRFYLGSITDGELPFPSGGADVAWIDARDIAAVAERALLEPGHAGETYEITGPRALTLPRTAAVLSEALGREVRHREVGIEAAVAGVEGFERELTALTFERVRAGSFATVTGVVERITGRPARHLRELEI